MGERLWLHTAAHLRFYRRSRIVLGVGLAILGLWSLTLLPLFFGGSNAGRFNQLRSVAQQLTTLGWLLSAALGLYVTSTHLRNRSLQVILTRPGSPQLWLASVFASALIVAAAMQAIGAVVTLVLSLAWGVPYQIGFFYMAVNAVFQAAIVIAVLTTLGAVLHPVVAFLVFVLFNENTFESLRFGVELMKAQNHGGWFLDVGAAARDRHPHGAADAVPVRSPDDRGGAVDAGDRDRLGLPAGDGGLQLRRRRRLLPARRSRPAPAIVRHDDLSRGAIDQRGRSMRYSTCGRKGCPAASRG